jgi:hypothetical protein
MTCNWHGVILRRSAEDGWGSVLLFFNKNSRDVSLVFQFTRMTLHLMASYPVLRHSMAFSLLCGRFATKCRSLIDSYCLVGGIRYGWLYWKETCCKLDSNAGPPWIAFPVFASTIMGADMKT